ncbi:ATP phosphoribosyltransferase regulatory subunit [Desulfosporosinus sp. BICA1-9]|uniref:ATP phosphoribosyltransferase regulatory subunit n=1 Tax=Desulfosporosinus sp. BICA1-9 TaxID=1531958 RepID=UPI00054B918C|nr:ATP phosphoribosyltransferase regulatory subunit [Desulfosporosinus sp. BICA1-9]KJS49750.1 MAG: ATP phosphoribosyltransferase [Peptococcaceae bacterium BRH_c23]KJS90196.1 MAG: ATP phosphoribosyltransferase [Desulfosporosinus sp. BICA1-9]HBW38788.1 ATP phosphoribosyltransferase regulatory subunit [Desulfosporosinus sp.]
MLRTNLGLRIPMGMRDLLPEEVLVQERLEEQILTLFRQWSYQKVLTPTLEFSACVQPDVEQDDSLYKFFDRNGHILTMRPELTIPIARLVSTRMRGGEFPLRLCYGADVYRNTTVRHREFRQVGVELVGSDQELADAEVIALAVEAIAGLGLKNYQFNLGHMGIFKGLMLEAGVEEGIQAKLEEALARKDMVGVESLVRQSGLPGRVQELLLHLPHFHGGEEILDEVLGWSERPAIRQAVESLRRIYRYLKDFGVQANVSLDLGILRGFSYYTGAVFEGYVPGMGFPVVEGGRYDALYADFGVPQPATGFAIHLGNLLEQFPLPAVEGADVLVYGADAEQIIRQCQVLRASGKRVEMALGTMAYEEAQLMARQKNIKEILGC